MKPNCELSEHVQRVYYYDRWANNHVFDAMLAMGDPPQRDADRMCHLVAALELWHNRVLGKDNPPTDLFHPGWTLAEGKSRLHAVHDGWSRVLAPLDDQQLLQEITWTRYEGGLYKAMLRDIVTQLPLHGAYHRGQLSITLKAQLSGPLEIDYIFTTWEPAGSGE